MKKRLARKIVKAGMTAVRYRPHQIAAAIRRVSKIKKT